MICVTPPETPAGPRREIRLAHGPAGAPGYDAGMSAPATPPVSAGDLLTLPELRHLRRLSALRGACLVLHAWAVIAGAMILYAAWPSALTLGLAIAVIGARQLGLLVLMHDAAHWRLFPHPGLNTRVGQWLCAHPVWSEMAAYRARHHLHHRHTRQPDDPDLALAPALPRTRGRFWRDVLCDLAGVTAVARLLRADPWRAGTSGLWSRWRGPLATNAVLCGVLAALGHWSLYPLLWLLPLATWYQLATRIRDVAEHGLVSDDGDPLRNTRTTAAGLLARIFLAPYWVNYHLEHHLMVFVPCWKLPQAHAILLARGCGPRMEMAASYLEVIRQATSPR
jgi:fatty acid desaturase